LASHPFRIFSSNFFFEKQRKGWDTEIYSKSKNALILQCSVHRDTRRSVQCAGVLGSAASHAGVAAAAAEAGESTACSPFAEARKFTADPECETESALGGVPLLGTEVPLCA
jgi:hypothetical protein